MKVTATALVNGRTVTKAVNSLGTVTLGKEPKLRVRVTALARELSQRSLVAARTMGDVAALHCKGIDIVVTGLRAPTHAPDCFEKLGIDAAKYDLSRAT